MQPCVIFGAGTFGSGKMLVSFLTFNAFSAQGVFFGLPEKSRPSKIVQPGIGIRVEVGFGVGAEWELEWEPGSEQA